SLLDPAVAPLKAAKPERSSMESEEMTANLASPRPRGVSRRAAGPWFIGVFTRLASLARNGLMAIVVIFSLQILLEPS
ncbi:MAG: hypothetical protein EB137_04280, partial [Actinobacteria bacterium]|nr:hypothetical protein [Actinomycetota bacterium]